MPPSIAQNLSLTPGTLADYHTLAPYHYLPSPPCCISRILTIRYLPPAQSSVLSTQSCPFTAAIAIEAFPLLACSLRRIALPGRYDALSPSLAAQRINHEIRSIARIIVHPTFRGLGLASRLIRHLLHTAQTPFTEALATMGHIHPLFQNAGMTPYHRPHSPSTTQLLTALAHENLTPHDLPTLQPTQLSPSLQKQLLHFLHPKKCSRPPRHPLTPQALLLAHNRLTAYPIYYLHQNTSAPPPTLPKPAVYDGAEQTACTSH